MAPEDIEYLVPTSLVARTINGVHGVLEYHLQSTCGLHVIRRVYGSVCIHNFKYGTNPQPYSYQ